MIQRKSSILTKFYIASHVRISINFHRHRVEKNMSLKRRRWSSISNRLVFICWKYSRASCYLYKIWDIDFDGKFGQMERERESERKKKSREKLGFSNVYCFVEKWNCLKKPILTQLLMDFERRIEHRNRNSYLLRNIAKWMWLDFTAAGFSCIDVISSSTHSSAYGLFCTRKYSKQFIVENELVY